jgi:hypothetical protein
MAPLEIIKLLGVVVLVALGLAGVLSWSNEVAWAFVIWVGVLSLAQRGYEARTCRGDRRRPPQSP